MGVVVAFETSTRTGSVAAMSSVSRPAMPAGDAGRVATRRLERGRAHASDLLPATEQVLAELGARKDEIAAIVVGTGPGSFTGLRVACATALGLARGLGVEAFGLPSYESLAFERLAAGQSAAMLFDARGGALYFAHYRRTAEDVEVVTDPCLLAPPDAGERFLAAAASATLAFVDEAAALAAGGVLDGRREPNQDCAIVRDAIPSAGALVELGHKRWLEGRLANPRPLYLRDFGQEPNREGPAPSRTSR